MGSQAGGTSRVTIESQQQNVMVSNAALQDIGRAVSQKKENKLNQNNNKPPQQQPPGTAQCTGEILSLRC